VLGSAVSLVYPYPPHLPQTPTLVPPNAQPPPRKPQPQLRRFNGETSQALVEEPDLDVFVFCKVDRECGTIPDGPNGETAEINAGERAGGAGALTGQTARAAAGRGCGVAIAGGGRLVMDGVSAGDSGNVP